MSSINPTHTTTQSVDCTSTLEYVADHLKSIVGHPLNHCRRPCGPYPAMVVNKLPRADAFHVVAAATCHCLVHVFWLWRGTGHRSWRVMSCVCRAICHAVSVSIFGAKYTCRCLVDPSISRWRQGSSVRFPVGMVHLRLYCSRERKTHQELASTQTSTSALTREGPPNRLLRLKQSCAELHGMCGKVYSTPAQGE